MHDISICICHKPHGSAGIMGPTGPDPIHSICAGGIICAECCGHCRGGCDLSYMEHMITRPALYSSLCMPLEASLIRQALILLIPFAQEASSVRSAVATALAASGASWPAFMPVHDPTRDAWQGVSASSGVTRLHETDSIRLSRPPPRLCQVSPTICSEHCLHAPDSC